MIRLVLPVVAALLIAGCTTSTDEAVLTAPVSEASSTTAAPPTTAPPVTTAPESTTTTVTTTTTTLAPPVTEGLPPILVGPDGTKPFEEWLAIAQVLSPSIVRPSDCGTPLDEPESLPNSDRSYRGGVHKGVDFICEEYGRTAVAALPGQVLMANNTFVDPTSEERAAALDTAQQLGYTPPWTLAMLYGRFVVVDHGLINGAGHVVSLYAHLNEIDPGIRPGLRIEAGTPLGEIGNRGTATGASRGNRARSIHLHWDLYVDTGFFGQGLTADETSAVYTALLEPGSGT